MSIAATNRSFILKFQEKKALGLIYRHEGNVYPYISIFSKKMGGQVTMDIISVKGNINIKIKLFW